MSAVFSLLADPTRRQIIEALGEGEHSVGSLVERLAMSQPAVSKQLRVLREGGLASVRREAQRRLYRLDARALRDVDDWLRPFRAAWEERVNKMEDVLSSMEE